MTGVVDYNITVKDGFNIIFDRSTGQNIDVRDTGKVFGNVIDVIAGADADFSNAGGVADLVGGSGGGGKCIFADGVGYAVDRDLGAVSQTGNIVADVESGNCCTEVFDIQVTVDSDKVESVKTGSIVHNGVFIAFVHNGGFAEGIPTGGNQLEFCTGGYKFADNGDCTDVGVGSGDVQHAADVQFQTVNSQRTGTQNGTDIKDKSVGIDVTGNSHFAENDHFAGVFAVERTYAASGFTIGRVDNAAGIEGTACINSNTSAVVNCTSPAEGCTIDNIQITDFIDLQRLITAVDKFTIVAVCRGIFTINSQGHFAEVVFAV